MACGCSGARATSGLFKQLAFVVAIVGALLALRNVGWLGFLAILTLPRALDGLFPRRAASRSPVLAGLAVASVVGTGLALVALAASPSSELAKQYPPPVADAVAGTLREHPEAIVFAGERYADWLLWSVPRAQGHVAFDARFELLSNEQLERLYRWTTENTDSWRAAAAGSSFVLVYRPHDGRKVAALRRSGAHVLLSQSDAALLRLPDGFGSAPAS